MRDLAELIVLDFLPLRPHTKLPPAGVGSSLRAVEPPEMSAGTGPFVGHFCHTCKPRDRAKRRVVAARQLQTMASLTAVIIRRILGQKAQQTLQVHNEVEAGELRLELRRSASTSNSNNSNLDRAALE